MVTSITKFVYSEYMRKLESLVIQCKWTRFYLLGNQRAFEGQVSRTIIHRDDNSPTLSKERERERDFP